MLHKLILVGVFVGASASVPILYQSNPEAFESLLRGREQPAEAPQLALVKPEPHEPSTEVLLGRKVKLSADGRGHFNADFKLNGRSVDAMVDTGATLVAINVSTARRIGMKLTEADFVHAVETANGTAKAAAGVIERLQIGRIDVADVQAVVLEDKALSGTLIGMSFLGRLKKFQIENGALLLEQ